MVFMNATTDKALAVLATVIPVAGFGVLAAVLAFVVSR